MKPLMRLALCVTALADATGFVASAQSVISAKSGVVHYVEGRVFLNDKLIESKFGEFPDIKENEQLRTEDGRVEVLLTPGVFLRLGENSAIRMISNRLIDTRVDFLSGEALVEADDLPKDNGVTVVYKGYSVQLQKKGVYSFDSETSQMRVYDGEALVQLNGNSQQVRDGHALAMDGGLQVAAFNKKDVDDLYRWGSHRSEYISMANVSAAKMVADSGSYWPTSSWYFNPYYDMYTFVPGFGYGLGMGMGGYYYNPFGYSFWSPYNVYGYINALPFYGGSPIGTVGAGNRLIPSPVKVPRGVSPAAVAMRTVVASNHERAGASGGGFGHGGVASASSGSFTSVSSHSGMSAAGHSGGGGGHK